MENCEKYDILLQAACGNGAILAIFSDFGRGQPKKHFFFFGVENCSTKGSSRKCWRRLTRGEGGSQMLTIANEGGGGVNPLLTVH